MVYFYRFLLLYFVALFPVATFATVPTITKYRASYSASPYFEALSAACNDGVAWRNANVAGFMHTLSGITTATPISGVCQITSLKSNCETSCTFTVYSINWSGLTGQCPANSTLSGGSCTCTAPYVQNSAGTACIGDSPLQICKDSQTLYNSTIGERYTEVEMPGSISSGTSVCVPSSFTAADGSSVSCTMNFEKDISFQDASGNWVSRGTLDMGGMTGNYSTLPCGVSTPSIPTLTEDNLDPPCPAGEQMGSINGVSVCKPYGPDVTSTTDDLSSTQTNPDGTTTTTKTTTSCVGSVCTTTTTTTTGTSVSTEVSTTSKGNFCAENPGSAQCDSLNDGGGGGGSGSCVGSDAAGCQPLGSLGSGDGAEGKLLNTNKPMTITADTGWGPSNGSCPAPKVAKLSGFSLTIPLDLLCEFADMIRPIVLGLAYLGAAFTFFGIGRKA